MATLLIQFRTYTFMLDGKEIRAKVLKKNPNGIIVIIDGMLKLLKNGSFALIS